MRETLSISALGKQTGVSSKTLRFWEGRGVLPRAARSHTGYRPFGPESAQYVAFVQRSKQIGLTLAEMRRLLENARSGRNPCPEVVRWTERKLESVEKQIRALSVLRRRLKQICRKSKASRCPSDRCAGICYLVAGLPIAARTKGGDHDAQGMAGTRRAAGGACG